MTRNVTTSITEEEFKVIRENHLHYNELIHRGLVNWKQQDGFIMRIRELEEGNAKLQAKITFLSEQFYKQGAQNAMV